MQRKLMIRSFVLLIVVAMLAGRVCGQDSFDDPLEPDTVFVDSVVAYTTDDGIVPVRFFNDELLEGLEVTLRHSSAAVTLDSFSFEGGLLAGADNKGVAFSADRSTITIFVLDAIPVSSGLLGHLYYSWPGSIAPQVVTIDTTTYSVGPIVRSTAFSYLDQMTFVEFTPQFQIGYLDIQAPPSAFDSVWIDDFVVEKGQSFVMGVNFYNEDDVVDIQIALDYGATYLHFDSVSFSSVRPLPTITSNPIVQNQAADHELLLKLTFDEATPLDSGSGPVARLHFTADAAAPETLLIINTTEFAGFFPTTVTRALTAGGDTFVPFFNAGSVEIAVLTDVQEVDQGWELPADYSLAQNYPNPFNPTTQIQFSLPAAGHARIEVFNVLGRRVRTLVDQQVSAGVHEISFDGRSESGNQLASGVYFYRLELDEFTETRKMVMLK